MATLSQTLRKAISEGAPMYNNKKKKECFDIYLQASKEALSYENVAESSLGVLLSQAVDKSAPLEENQEYGEGAWVLRRAFDQILKDKESVKLRLIAPSNSEPMMQDEKAQDMEKAKEIVNVARLLQDSLTTGSHTLETETYEECFTGSEAVDFLKSSDQGVENPEEQCTTLLLGGFLVSISNPDEKNFKGSRLYRFPEPAELQASLDNLQANDQAQVEGSDENLAMLALQISLNPDQYSPAEEDKEEPAEAEPEAVTEEKKTDESDTDEEMKGRKLASLAAQVESVVDIADRKYRLKKYEKCFVGKDAVGKLVEEGIALNRVEAAEKMDELLQIGIIHHVTKAHRFEDENLFYRFSTQADITETLSTLSSSAQGYELVEYTALSHRFKQIESQF